MNSREPDARGTGHAPPHPVDAALSVREGLARAAKDFDWLAKNVPCRAACPAGTDIPAYLEAIADDRLEDAYRINLRDNVFPAVLGRVCTRPCEPACRHGWPGLGEPVAICHAKRAADALEGKPSALPPLFPASERSVGVVGGGAAGLAMARDLARFGHRVTVYERHAQAGGMMVQGIPAFRLPRDIVAREVNQVARAGVDIRCDVEIGRDHTLNQLRADHDAVVLATGTHQPVLPDLPGRDLDGVRHGLPFLKDVNLDREVAVGNRVLVIGGGFTAVDCARAARRLGADRVAMYYRRSEAEMYITPDEVEEMRAEGVAFETLTAPVRLDGENGRVTSLTVADVELGPPDDSGRRTPVPKAGSERTLEADTVLLATGQRRSADAAGAEGREGEGVFLAGDVDTGPASLVDAIGHARACARRVDRFLMGYDRLEDAVEVEKREATGRERAWDDLPRRPMPVLPVDQRELRDEVECGYGESEAREEARRCYLCNLKFEIDNDLCIYCDRCLKVMPVEKCIVKIQGLSYDEQGRITGYAPSKTRKDYNLLYLDQSECIRCGACVEVCPVDCITLQKVTPVTVRR